MSETLLGRQAHLHALRDAMATTHHSVPFTPPQLGELHAAVDSYLAAAAEEFIPAHDHFRLVGEDNWRRYLPAPNLWIRLHADDSPLEIFLRAAAARAAGCRVVVSIAPENENVSRETFNLLDVLTDSWAAAIEFVEESDEELAAAMRSSRIGRVRYARRDRVPEAVRRASAESYVYVADAPVLPVGRIELLWYVQEQSLSHVYHRYGNLGRRVDEPRAAVL